MNKLSIKWRLAIQFSSLVLLVLLLFGTAVFILVTQRGRQDIDAQLSLQYENIRGSIQDSISSHESLDTQDETLQKMDTAKYMGLLVVVLDPKGQPIAHSSNQKITPPWVGGYSDSESDGDRFRFYQGKVSGYAIIVGQNLHAFDENETSLLLILIIVSTVMLALSFGISAVFAGNAIQPLRVLHANVRAIDPRALPDSPLASQYPDDEIGRLAASFDEFLTKLEQAFERERQFTQDASHEFRTPLMVLKSSVELLGMHPKRLDSLQKEKLSLMEGSIRQMEVLAEELLFLSRGFKEMPKQKIAIGTFLKEFIPSFSAMAEQKQIALSLHVLKDFSVQTSRAALEKVVGNLLKNAIKFTPEKGSIDVAVDHQTIQVKDTGIGIASKDTAHIFERFYQANSSRTKGQEGFGLGLAICKQICAQEGWNIEVESGSGKGSTFTVTFA